MAGSLPIIKSKAHLECHPVTEIRDHWHDIHYSRFFTLPDPSISSSCPALVLTRRGGRSHGTWISTSSPTASLHITTDVSNTGAILNICFREKILEEHYVSKLHFSWPQISCVPGYPARGSRNLLISYKDSVGKIQKFAVQFPTICEAQTFINALKETLKEKEIPDAPYSDFRSEISSQSEFMSSNRLPSRACEEEMSTLVPVDTYTPEMPPNLNYEAEPIEVYRAYEKEISTLPPADTYTPEMPPNLNHEAEPIDVYRAYEKKMITLPPVDTYTSEMRPNLNYDVKKSSCTQQLMPNLHPQGISEAFPPSFSSLLASCHSAVKQASAQPTVSDESDLKSQIMRYMEDSSFQDMLIKVEKVIGDMAGDFVL